MGLERSESTFVTTPDVFWKSPEEDVLCDDIEAYLARTQGEFRVLDNGLKIVGFPDGSFDKQQAKVVFRFPHCPAFDPPGKIGISHSIEHLLGLSIVSQADRFLGTEGHNGHIDWDTITYEAKGFVFPDSDEFGLPAFVPSIAAMLRDPLGGIADPEKAVAAVIKRILIEINKERNNHAKRVFKLEDEYFFAPKNPYSEANQKIGIPQDVTSISLTDTRNHFARTISPNRAIVTASTYGNPSVNRYVVDTLEQYLGDWNQSPDSCTQLPIELLDRFNPQFREGDTYEADTNIRNNQVSVIHAWKVPASPFSVDDFTLKDFGHLANQATFNTAEKHGLAYNAQAYVLGAGTTKVFCIEMTAATNLNDGNGLRDYRDLADEISQSIQDEVLAIPEDMIDFSVKKRNTTLGQIPIDNETRIYYAAFGLRNYNAIIDAEKAHGVYQQVGTNEITTLLSTIRNTPRARLIIGDLSH